MRGTTQYDKAAPDFNRRRALPQGVAASISAAVVHALAPLERPRILDLGAGAGRIGEAFVAADHDYVGVDLSPAMLRRFKEAVPRARLALADGERLPFAQDAFDAVLLVQVLNSAGDWHALLREVRRVLRGALILGRTLAPDDGIDARLKQQLAGILACMGHDPYRSAGNDTALDWLGATAGACDIQTVAGWPSERTPRAFIERHSTGARFSALPSDVQTAALTRLRRWIDAEIGSLDTVSTEVQRFELRIYRFHQRTKD